MEVKAFNLRGQPLPFNPIDYERAYYSSFLRSIRPMNYPKIILYPLMNRMEILKPIVKNLVAFSMQQYSPAYVVSCAGWTTNWTFARASGMNSKCQLTCRWKSSSTTVWITNSPISSKYTALNRDNHGRTEEAKVTEIYGPAFREQAQG